MIPKLLPKEVKTQYTSASKMQVPMEFAVKVNIIIITILFVLTNVPPTFFLE